MKATRLGLSFCFAFYSFVLFCTVNGLHEIAYDQLDGRQLPFVVMLTQIFDTIGLLMLGYPILIGFACWRCLECAKPTFQLFLIHFLLVGFSSVIFACVLVATPFLTYLNGVHPMTGIRVGGNILIGVGVLTIIVRSYLHPKRTEQ